MAEQVVEMTENGIKLERASGARRQRIAPGL